MRTLGLLTLILITAAPATAELITEYSVEYSLRGDVSQATHFYGDGAYIFLLGPDYTTVYLHNINWIFRGMYGAPAAGYPEAMLPVSMPSIIFPAGTDIAGAVPIIVSSPPETIAVPEPGSAWIRAAGMALLLAALYARKSTEQGGGTDGGARGLDHNAGREIA